MQTSSLSFDMFTYLQRLVGLVVVLLDGCPSLHVHPPIQDMSMSITVCIDHVAPSSRSLSFLPFSFRLSSFPIVFFYRLSLLSLFETCMRGYVFFFFLFSFFSMLACHAMPCHNRMSTSIDSIIISCHVMSSRKLKKDEALDWFLR